MHTHSVLITITGHPASGKSQLAQRLGRDLEIPVLHRDVFKEILFDTMGPFDIPASQSLGPTSYALLHEAARALMAARIPVIIDSNYSAVPGRDEVMTLLREYDYRSLELVLQAPAPVLATRFRRRIANGTRHPVHHDLERLMEFMDRLTAPYQPLNLGGDFLTIDTSEPDNSYYPQLIAYVKDLISATRTRPPS